VVRTTTVADYQATQRDADDGSRVDQIYSLNIQTIDEDDALGLVVDKVRRACDIAGLEATEEDIRTAANGIWAQNGRPGATPTRDWRHDASGVRDTVTNGAGESAEMGTPEAESIVEGAVRAALGQSATDYSHAELPGMPAPKSVLRAPQQAEFGEDDAFIVSSALAKRAKVLIDRHADHLEHLDGMSVVYLWKKSGGKSKGRLVFGKCTKPAGLLKLFSESTFVVWLAADHVIAAGYDDRQIEALLFHEMLHTGVAEADEETGRGGGPTLVPHELEVFRAEVEIYGLWAPELRAIAPAFTQPGLFDAQAGGSRSSTTKETAEQETGAGTLIHPDGTPMTAEEVAEQEAAELRDDPADPDAEYDEDDDLTDLR
jgi:hypothetical protein